MNEKKCIRDLNKFIFMDHGKSYFDESLRDSSVLLNPAFQNIHVIEGPSAIHEMPLHKFH